MRILFTGSSSFTGYWFVKALAEAGHEVTACMRSARESGSALRRQRSQEAENYSKAIYEAPFGSPRFLEAVASEKWDILCHHGAEVTNYRSPDFDAMAAAAQNTFHIKEVLKELQKVGCTRILLSGSIFEQNEGAGDGYLRAVSPYGLSKGITSDVFRYYTAAAGMHLGKFVIPNPFGPYEEERYTGYLARTWLQGEKVEVKFPQNERDNIPVTLLAKAYAEFLNTSSWKESYEAFHPSFYAESNAAFTERCSRELGRRWGMPCAFDLKKQTDFSEPLVRLNYDKLDPAGLGWDEKAFWDELAAYYQKEFGAQS